MSDDDLPPWTGVLADIAEVAGEAVAARLAHEVGGSRLWIPKTAGEDTELVRLVGREAAEAIIDRLGAGEVIVPIGRAASHAQQRRAIRKLLRKGLSCQHIARELRCHLRTVERVASQMGRADTRQLDLLDRR